MSLLLDALRKAEKVKEAKASGKRGGATDIPLLVEETRVAEANAHGLVLVDMADAGEDVGESAVASTGSRTRNDEAGQESLGRKDARDRNDHPGDSRVGVQSELNLGDGDARSLFDLNGESAYRRRWRWGFIGTGITLIVALSAYYGWLLYVAVKPSAGLVPRQLPVYGSNSVVSAPPANYGPAQVSAPETVVEPPVAGSGAKLPAPAEAGKPVRDVEVSTAREVDRSAEAPVTGTVTKAPPPTSAPDNGERGRAGGGAFTHGSKPSAEPGSARPVLTITRNRRQDPVFSRLEQAYRAYRAGDHAQAEAQYRFVLAQQPDNRDARLGMAALAVSKGRLDEATGLYRRVLELSPDDQAALAALASIQEDRDPLESESRLKRLLAKNPDAPSLHFALGNLYGAQGRWSEAQQAYFDAYRRDSENGDYAYNLAVGLDHLGQRQTALRYYRLALEAAGREDVGFEPAAVRRRVQTLSRGPANSGP